MCVPAVLCQPTQLAALRRALLKGKRVPAIVCVDLPPPALALRCIQLHLSLPTSLLVLAPESPAVGGASAKAVRQSVSQSLPPSYQRSTWSACTRSVLDECDAESQSQGGVRGRRLGKGGTLPSGKSRPKAPAEKASADSPSSTPRQRQITLLQR